MILRRKIKVLVVDDSAVVRQTLSQILESDDTIEVMATAADPFGAAEKIRHEVPDVITLDVEMPRMDGITFLQKIMSQHPIPVVMCSSLTEKGSMTALNALECGAVDIIEKPKIGTKKFFEESKVLIIPELRAKILFRRLNFMDEDYQMDAPVNVIFFRNVLIYFNRETQEKVITRLCRYLHKGGYFFTGHSETLSGLNVPLVQAAPTVYRRI